MTMSRWFTTVFAVLALGACTNEKIVYQTKAPFNPAPDSLNGFLGYYDVATKQTTCGNCHVEKQGNWASTKHSEAWADLQASGHASASCEGCHSVSGLGNAVGQPAGYSVTPDTVYQDVQCENCHGPGAEHVASPTTQNEPLASIEVDTGQTNGCGGCHTGVHNPFVDQWVQSAHGSGPGFSHAAGNPTCNPCHEGRTALAVKFGVSTNYVERDGATNERIVCVVCHDPHGATPNEGQLRAPINEPTTDNLCVRCHSRSGVPPWSTASAGGTSRGAHGAQGLLVIGQNVGWIPPNFTYDTGQIVSSHGTSANPRLCATCHVAFTTVTDQATGAFKFQSVGHLFAPIPCLDTAGIPTTDENCALAQRDFSACATSGCHLTQQAARSAFQAVDARLNNLLDQIWLDSNNDRVIDPAPTDGGLLPQIVARGTAADSAALDFTSSTTTVAKGTLWNAALAATNERQNFLGGKVFGVTFATHMASGNGVHNPFLLEALLTSSISALKSAYGLTAPANVDLTVHATPPPGLRVRTSLR